jgi:hypothetical protein
MNSVHRKVLVTLIAVLACGAVASASASASSWYVGGAELSSPAPVTSSTQVVEGITLEFSNNTINCSGLELKGGELLAHNGGQVEHMVFTGCILHAGASNCTLSGGKIESKPLKLEAALGSKSPEDTVVFKPATGKVFAEYSITGASCPLAEEGIEVEGQPAFVLPKGREESAEQELLVRGKLTGGIGIWSFGGAVKAKLTSGKNWSFH